MNIGIDIDDTINCLHDQIIKYGTEFNQNRKIDFLINQNEWAWDKAFGWDDKTSLEFLREHIEVAYLNAEIKENAKEVINKLHKEGNKIVVITSRSELHCEDPYTTSKIWLDKQGVEFDELIVGAEDKASICNQEKIDVFIDDHVDFCEGVSKTKTKVLMFDSPYNQNETRYKRVYSWNEVYKNIVNEN